MISRGFTIALVVLFGFGIVSSVTNAQESSKAPFMYYYSDFVDSWIIERADGTDSRMIGAGLTINDPFSMEWSHSGEWFAWTSGFGFFQIPFELWIVHRDGKHRITITDALNGYYDFDEDEAGKLRQIQFPSVSWS